MTIRISLGLRGEYSPFISFLGISSMGQGSGSAIISITSVNASTNGADLVSVENTAESIRNHSTVYELSDVHYTDFVNHYGAAFPNAPAVADYINDQAELLTENVTRHSHLLDVGISTITVSSGAAFTHGIGESGILNVFWDEDTFPSGVTVSPFDRRIVTGIITNTGNYYLAYDKANSVGISTSSLHIEVE